MGGVDICAIASRIDLTFNNLTSVKFVYTYISTRYVSNQCSLISYSFFYFCFLPEKQVSTSHTFLFSNPCISPSITLNSKELFIHPERQMHLVCTPRITAANKYAPAIRRLTFWHASRTQKVGLPPYPKRVPFRSDKFGCSRHRIGGEA